MREQRKMRKEHLQNSTLREAKRRPLERKERQQLKREAAQRTSERQGGVRWTGLQAGVRLRSIGCLTSSPTTRPSPSSSPAHCPPCCSLHRQTHPALGLSTGDPLCLDCPPEVYTTFHLTFFKPLLPGSLRRAVYLTTL